MIPNRSRDVGESPFVGTASMVKSFTSPAPQTTVDDLFLSAEEGRRQFNEAVRERMGISGDEFIRRYEAGAYDEIEDRDGFRHIGHLIGLISFAR